MVGVDRPFEGGTATTTFHYDRLGRRDQIVDPVQATFTWVFDSLGRVRTSTEPDRGTTGFTWDDAGRLWTQTDAKGQVTTLDYDDAGRLETRTSTTGTATYVYGEPRPGYFNVGRLTSILWPSSQDTLRFDYDALGRVARQWRTFEGVDYTVSKTWGAGGYHLTTTYPDGETVGPMGYDEAGRVKSVPGFVSDLTWDALGRPDTKTNANGVFTDWTWSPNRGLLDRIKTTTAGGAILQDLTYTQRAAGLVQSVTSPVAGEGWTYDYDDFYHLTTATNHSYPAESQTFDYDAGGRIETNSRVGVYTYATGRHRPQTVGGSTLVYDANGNLVSGGGRAPVWNAENLITQIGTTQFKYDALGERVKKTSGTTTSLYPFGDDYEITNGVVTKYISIEGVGVVAKKVTGGSSPGTYWFLSDHLGSLQGVLDVNGAAISRRTYRPYGQTLGQSGSHTESRGWIDQRNDSETGLTYLHARYFDPQLGTFLSADPIGVEGGLNQYGYGFGDPINSADRNGLDPTFVFCQPWPACAWSGGGGGGSPGGGGFSAPGSPWPYGSPPPDHTDRSVKGFLCFWFGAFCGPTPGSTLTGPNMALPQQGPPQDRGVTMPDHPTGAPAGATPSGGSKPPPPPPPGPPPPGPPAGPTPRYPLSFTHPPRYTSTGDWVIDGLQGAAGFCDAASLGLGPVLRGVLDWEGSEFVDVSSDAYALGDKASMLIGMGRVAYAAGARGLSLAGLRALRSGADRFATAGFVNGGRNGLRMLFRLNIPSRHMLTFEQALKRYGRDPVGIIAGAGRTNLYYNLWGAGTASYAWGASN